MPRTARSVHHDTPRPRRHSRSAPSEGRRASSAGQQRSSPTSSLKATRDSGLAASTGSLAGAGPRWSSQLRFSDVKSSGYGYGHVKRVTIAPPEPVVDYEALERERLEEERRVQEAEEARQRELRARAARRRDLLAQVKQINTKIVVRHCARRWRMVTASAREAGPHGLPESERAFVQLGCSSLKTPKDAVVSFLLGTFKYKKDRGAGERMLARTLHPELLVGNFTDDLDDFDFDAVEKASSRTSIPPPSPSKRKLRKSTRLRLQTLRSNTLASYVVGTSPENGYALDPERVGFKFNLLLSTAGFGKADAPVPEGGRATVHVITSGALPPTRAVELKYHKGRWKVVDFSNLCTNVLPPAEHPAGVTDTDETDAPTWVRATSPKPSRRSSVDRGRVEGHMRIFDTEGNVIGYERTRASLKGPISKRPTLPAIRTSRSYTGYGTGFTPAPQMHRSKVWQSKVDEEEPDLERHARARESTQLQAEALAAAEFVRKFEAEPKIARRIVTSGVEPSGKIAEVLLKMKSKGTVTHEHIHSWLSSAKLATKRAHNEQLPLSQVTSPVPQASIAT